MAAIIGWGLLLALVINYPVLLWVPVIWIALILING